MNYNKARIIVSYIILLTSLLIGLYIRNSSIPLIPVLRNLFAHRELVPKTFHLEHLRRHLANETTVLITAKDTCSQTIDVLRELREQIPGETAVRISLPSVGGCKDVLSSSLDEVHALFPDTAVTYRDNFNPFTAWRLDSMHVTTRYSLLMHNDVYFIDRGGILKMYSTMREQERRGYKVVVPMIYEREGNVSLSPHAVHDELHIDPTTSPPTLGHMMDLKKGLTRWEDQMEPGAQTHFLEDHAFMVLTDFVNCLIDPGSAYTMEYIDMYLNMMHEDGVKPYFEPESRIEFRVRHDDLSLGDIPYMAGRRSEINALGNHRYLEKKWKAQFFFTSAWNYIKFATMRDTHSYSVSGSTPSFVSSPVCFSNLLFFTWFEFIGMNHYDGERLWDVEKKLCDGKGKLKGKKRKVKVERRVNDKIDVKDEWNDRDSKGILPYKTLSQKPFVVKPRMNYKMYPTLVLQVTYNSSETPSSVCGLIVSTKVSGSQECYVFVPPFEYDRENSWHIWAMEKLLSVVKTASRSSIYYSMRNKMQDLTKVAETIKSGTTREVTAYHCEGVTMEQDYNEQRCEFEIHFDPEDQLTKWSGRLHSVMNIVKQLTSK